MFISESIKYVGVDDKDIDLFESQYVVPEGVSYNSYVILDEKIAVMDTVDARGMEGWEDKLLQTLNGLKILRRHLTGKSHHILLYHILSLTMQPI